MAGPDGLPFILAPITFSWGGVVWEGVSETARGVVGWGKGARPFAMSPIAASYRGFWALATYPHVQTWALVE